MSAGTALALLAERVSVAPAELQQTLMNTAFKGATEAEFVALIAVANKYDLDPFVREIYAFPKKGGGIVPLVPIDGWLKIIKRHPDYAGMDVRWADEMVKPGNSARQCPEWVEVTIHHKSTPDHPTVHREWIDEMYRDTGPWNTTTKRMLEWKGIIQTGRVAFGLSGIFDQDEAERIVENSVDPDTGEITSKAEPARPALGAYPEPDFTANLPAWRKAIESGRKTPDDLIAMVSTKAVLSEVQKRAIRNLQPIDAQPSTDAGAPDQAATQTTAQADAQDDDGNAQFLKDME